MLKKIALLASRAEFDQRAFEDYWRGRHGPLVSGSPQYARFRRRYLQNHIVAAGPVGRGFGYRGMAELWVAGAAPVADEFARSDIYLTRIRPDELRFLDMERSIAMNADEAFAPGRGGVKLVVFSACSEGLGRDEYLARMRGRHAPLVLQQPDVASFLRGYAQNHVRGPLSDLNGTAVREPKIDCIETFWFDDMAGLEAALRTRGWREAIEPGWKRIAPAELLMSFVAREIVFFEDGKVVTPPEA